MGDVELEEVEVVENAVDVCIADEDEDQEGNREEVEDGSGDGGVATGWRSSSEGLFGNVNSTADIHIPEQALSSMRSPSSQRNARR